MKPEKLAEWLEDAELRANRADSHLVFANRIIALIGALEDMTREARLSREATERAVRSRIARHELERAFRAADAPEDSMATCDDLLRYQGRAEAVQIMRDMLELDDA
jgi:hypothetical protein